MHPYHPAFGSMPALEFLNTGKRESGVARKLPQKIRLAHWQDEEGPELVALLL